MVSESRWVSTHREISISYHMGAKNKAKHKIFFNPVQSSVFSESSNAVPKLYFIEVALNTQVSKVDLIATL